MARDDVPRRPRDVRTGETPEPPQQARADDPTHGVDPYRDRSGTTNENATPGERPGLSGEIAHRGAMETAEAGHRRRRGYPELWLALVVGVLLIAAALLWV